MNIFSLKYWERNDVVLSTKCRYFKGETDTLKIDKPFGLVYMYVGCNIFSHVLANDNKPYHVTLLNVEVHILKIDKWAKTHVSEYFIHIRTCYFCSNQQNTTSIKSRSKPLTLDLFYWNDYTLYDKSNSS